MPGSGPGFAVRAPNTAESRRAAQKSPSKSPPDVRAAFSVRADIAPSLPPFTALELGFYGFPNEIEAGLVRLTRGVYPGKQRLVQRERDAKGPDRLPTGLLLHGVIFIFQIRT
jgi:hypothetical protein